MIDLATFAAGLGTIALQLNAGLTEAHHLAYFAAFEDETDAGEWAAFSRVAVKRCGWREHVVPSVPQMLDALREFRGAPPLLTEATAAYERVLEAGTYSPEAGRVWSYRGVREALGKAAADAFLAAGGQHAFATTWDEAKRRAAFVAAYTSAAREAPAERLLPAGEARKALGTGA